MHTQSEFFPFHALLSMIETCSTTKVGKHIKLKQQHAHFKGHSVWTSTRKQFNSDDLTPTEHVRADSKPYSEF